MTITAIDSPSDRPRRASARSAGQDISYLFWPAQGEGVAVVCAHPVNTSAEVWADIAGSLGGAGSREVIAVDYRGHGRSASGGPFRAIDYACDLAAVITARGHRRVHFVGGSIGGAVAAELHALQPGLLASISVMGAGVELRMPQEVLDAVGDELLGEGVTEWFAARGAGIVGSRALPGIPDVIAGLAGGRNPSTVADIIRTAFGTDSSRALAARLAGTYPPTLILVGDEDPTCPPSMADEIGALFGSTPTVLNGIGHLPMLEAPDQTSALIATHIHQAETSSPERRA